MSTIPVEYYNQDASKSVAIKSKWWEQKDDMHAHVFGVVAKIKEAQNYRTINNLRYARLYSNMELVGLMGGLYARANDSALMMQNRVTYNVIKSCVDTVAAKISKQKVRPFFLTDGGTWDLQRRAIRQNKYFEGLWASIGTGDGDNKTMYGLARRCFVDAAVFGTGATKFYSDGENVRAERVIIEEIVVDDVEGRYEQPRQMFQEKLMHRSIVLDMFPEYKDKILAATSGVGADQNGQCAADMITVVEAWHLPSSKDSDDGVKAICIENCTLAEDPWKKEYFPFAFQRWSPRLLGFYGAGLAEELIGIQLEINKMLRVIQISQHLMAVPQVWLETQSKVVSKHVNNEVGGLKFYSGKEPKFFVPQAMSAEMYQHLETLWNKAFQVTGVSQLSAASQKPAGVDAAVAMRQLQDIESERFMLQGLRYQDYYMDATNICRDLLDDLAAEGKNPAVRLKAGDHAQVYKWSECRLPKDSYTVTPYPASLLPDTPEGKLQKVQEMLAAGFWEKEEAMELLDFPDTKAVVNLKVAMRRDLKRQIEKIIDDQEYEAPEPFINLEMAKQLGQSYYNAGRADGMPEERLELLRRFMEDVQAMLTPPPPQPQAALPPGAPVPPPMPVDPNSVAPEAMAPIGVPEAPPVSELLPVQGA